MDGFLSLKQGLKPILSVLISIAVIMVWDDYIQAFQEYEKKQCFLMMNDEFSGFHCHLPVIIEWKSDTKVRE